MISIMRVNLYFRRLIIRNTSIIAFFSVNKNSGVSINELEGEIDCVLVVSYPV